VKAGQLATGWRGYFGMPGASQWMKVLRAPCTSRWWMQPWQMLSGNGGGAGGLESADIGSGGGSEKAGPWRPAFRESGCRIRYIE
jgi:hypothetical protein